MNTDCFKPLGQALQGMGCPFNQWTGQTVHVWSLKIIKYPKMGDKLNYNMIGFQDEYFDHGNYHHNKTDDQTVRNWLLKVIIANNNYCIRIVSPYGHVIGWGRVWNIWLGSHLYSVLKYITNLHVSNFSFLYIFIYKNNNNDNLANVQWNVLD